MHVSNAARGFPPSRSVSGRWGSWWRSAGRTTLPQDWRPCVLRKHLPKCRSPRTLNFDPRGRGGALLEEVRSSPLCGQSKKCSRRIHSAGLERSPASRRVQPHLSGSSLDEEVPRSRFIVSVGGWNCLGNLFKKWCFLLSKKAPYFEIAPSLSPKDALILPKYNK